MRCDYPLHAEPRTVPKTLVKAFRLEAQSQEGCWETVFQETINYQRLVRVKLDCSTVAIRFIPESTWGADQVHLFAFDVKS